MAPRCFLFQRFLILFVWFIFSIDLFLKIHIFFISMIITEKMKIKINIPDG